MQEWLRDTFSFVHKKPFLTFASIMLVTSTLTSACTSLRLYREIKARQEDDCQQDKATISGIRLFAETMITASSSNTDTPPDPERVEAFRVLIAESFPEPDC